MGNRLRAKQNKRRRDENAAVKKGTAPARHKVAVRRSKDYRFRRSNKMT